MDSTNASTNYPKSETVMEIMEIEKKKSSEDCKDRTKDEGHFDYKIGQIIQNYKVINIKILFINFKFI